MNFVDKKMSNENMIEYLKSIEVNGSSHHHEIDFPDYLVSVVMITMSTKTNLGTGKSFNVCVVCLDKTRNDVYDNLYFREFTDEKNAKDYYYSLIDKVNETPINELIKM